MKISFKKIAAILTVASTLFVCACGAETETETSTNAPETSAPVETTATVETTKDAVDGTESDKKIDYSKETRTVKIPIYDDGYEFAIFGFNENNDILRSENIPSGGAETYYTYDEDGKLLKTVNSEGGEERERCEYFYDGDRLIRLDVYEKNTFGANDSIDRYYLYEYDENGKMIREVCKSGVTDEFEYDTVFEYDAEGKLIEETEKGENCQYDNEGNLVSEEIDGALYTYEYENGLLSKMFKEGEIAIAYKYFDNGNIVRIYHYENENTITEINISLTSEM